MSAHLQVIGLLTTWMYVAAVNVAHHLATFVLMVLILHKLANITGGESVSVGHISGVGLAAASATMTLACAITCTYWV